MPQVERATASKKKRQGFISKAWRRSPVCKPRAS
jgi:hypothetical protein